MPKNLRKTYQNLNSSESPPKNFVPIWNCFLVARYATLLPTLSVHPSVHWSVRPLVRPSDHLSHFTFLVFFCGFLPHRSCPNDGVTSIMAPAHPHATGVAVYPALFTLKPIDIQKITSFACVRMGKAA